MSNGVIRNLLVTTVAVAAGVATGWLAYRNADQALVREAISNMWVVQAILGGAVAALIYRLQSDAGSVKGFSAAQRRVLDRVAAKKSWRLWALFALMCISALLSRLPPKLLGGHDAVVLGVAVGFAVTSAIWFCYVPVMWHELRRFLSDAQLQSEEDEKRKKLLDEFRTPDKSASKGEERNPPIV